MCVRVKFGGLLTKGKQESLQSTLDRGEREKSELYLTLFPVLPLPSLQAAFPLMLNFIRSTRSRPTPTKQI